MVKTFHLHNCGNSRDICEFTFLCSRTIGAAIARKSLLFNYLRTPLSFETLACQMLAAY